MANPYRARAAALVLLTLAAVTSAQTPLPGAALPQITAVDVEGSTLFIQGRNFGVARNAEVVLGGVQLIVLSTAPAVITAELPATLPPASYLLYVRTFVSRTARAPRGPRERRGRRGRWASRGRPGPWGPPAPRVRPDPWAPPAPQVRPAPPDRRDPQALQAQASRRSTRSSACPAPAGCSAAPWRSSTSGTTR